MNKTNSNKYYLKKEGLKQLLDKNLMDYRMLEQKSGVSKNTLHRIQRKNESDPKAKTLQAIAKALNCEVGKDETGIFWKEMARSNQSDGARLNKFYSLTDNNKENILAMIETFYDMEKKKKNRL